LDWANHVAGAGRKRQPDFGPEGSAAATGIQVPQIGVLSWAANDHAYGYQLPNWGGAIERPFCDRIADVRIRQLEWPLWVDSGPSDGKIFTPANVASWLQADILRGVPERPLYPQ
jgi:hypothetical protein